MNDTGRTAGETRVVKLTSQDVDDARRLLSLLGSPDEMMTIHPAPGSDEAVSVSKQSLLEKAKQLIASRRRRQEIFDRAMFGEPAWDMLLLLYARDASARQTIGQLSDLSGTTKTTALRWIDYLEKEQLVRREAHPTDRRAAFVQLTEKGRGSVELYLSETVAFGG